MATADTHSTARLEDVAALANVSLATASKALHGKPRVSEDTRERVMEAARQLNYSPNKLAQSLASGRSGTIGLVTSDLQGRFLHAYSYWRRKRAARTIDIGTTRQCSR